jgi:ribonuclease HII
VPTLAIESNYKGLVGGVDEVGRGPLAGPVMAAAAIFLAPHTIPIRLLDGIQDSKKLSRQKRAVLYQELLALDSFVYGVGEASVEEIDALNILQATFLAMQRAVHALPEHPQTLLVDGKFIPQFEGIRAIPLIKGDDVSLSIAAASIIAKERRDQLMEDLSTHYPLYGWEKNAGYGTKIHRDALIAHGVTPHHRKSFAPVAALLA